MADVTVKASEIHGTGVFAARDFAEGEIILEIDDSRVVLPAVCQLFCVLSCGFVVTSYCFCCRRED